MAWSSKSSNVEHGASLSESDAKIYVSEARSLIAAVNRGDNDTFLEKFGLIVSSAMNGKITPSSSPTKTKIVKTASSSADDAEEDDEVCVVKSVTVSTPVKRKPKRTSVTPPTTSAPKKAKKSLSPVDNKESDEDEIPLSSKEILGERECVSDSDSEED